MQNITLYEHPRSPYSQKVRLFMREKNLPFTTEMVPGLGAGSEDVEFRTLNPRREVPVLQVGSHTLCESTIILEYLEETFPNPPMMPPEPLARARARMLEDVFDTQWEAINWGLGELYYFKRGDTDLRSILRAAAEKDAALMYRWLERQFGDGEWLAGDQFGWADICAVPFVATTQRFGVFPEAGSAVEQWIARANERPSVKQTVAEAHAYHKEMPEAVAAMETGAFKREYRDHRLEWMIRAGGLDVVLDGLKKGNVRFTDIQAFAPEKKYE
jgi:glutathione S-transferase